MNISNLRKEEREGKIYLICDMRCSFSSEKELWFSVDKQYADWLTDDVYDAFLVEAIWPAMCYHEDIEIEGEVSEILFFHISSYLLKVILDHRPHYKIPKIHVSGFKNAETCTTNIVGTGFSGGIDSFTTIYDRFIRENQYRFKLNALFFFNIGQNGYKFDPYTNQRSIARFQLSKLFASEIGLPIVYVDSNMFDIYKPHWEYDAGPLCRASAILCFQKVCRIYYVSASFHYKQQKEFNDDAFDSETDSFIYYWLSTEILNIILDGGQYTRPEKTEHIIDYEPLQRYLNVCIKTDHGYVDTKNCSECHKCQRTLLALDALGRLDDFKEVFDVEKYRRNRRIQFAHNVWDAKHDPFVKENVIFAKEHGLRMPSRFEAFITLLPDFARRGFAKIKREFFKR